MVFASGIDNMSLTMTFLGAGSAFTVGENNFQSNVLLQCNGDSLLIDAGTDIRLSLFEQGKNHLDVRNVYISHLHSDHVGGMEWLALSTFFDPSYQGKPILYGAEHVVSDLWTKCLAGGLSTLPSERANLQTYFEVHPLGRKKEFSWQEIPFQLVQMIHVFNDYILMPCYGLLFNYRGTRIFYTSDTQFVPEQIMAFYDEADIIFHDCETSKFPTGVHAHYRDLRNLPAKVKAKIWLYHYNPGSLPDAKADGFLGFVSKGQCFNF